MVNDSNPTLHYITCKKSDECLCNKQTIAIRMVMHVKCYVANEIHSMYSAALQLPRHHRLRITLLLQLNNKAIAKTILTNIYLSKHATMNQKY